MECKTLWFCNPSNKKSSVSKGNEDLPDKRTTCQNIRKRLRNENVKKADSLQDKLSATKESEDIPMTKETNSNKQQTG